MSVDGPVLSAANVGLAALPILTLLVTILVFRWGAPKAGGAAFLVAAAVALLFFGADSRLLTISSSKGLSLSLFLLSIIWTSVLLYNVIDQTGGIKVIGKTMTRLVGDPLAQALVVGWAFSGFMQGIAGFGVPVAVVAPLLVLMGFHPAKAVAIVLIGHSWAVALGSLGSSYYTILLVTNLDGEVLAPHLAALLAPSVFLTGFAVAYLQGGMASVRRGALAIVAMASSMSLGVWGMAAIGAPQIASIVPGLIGCGVGWLVARSPALVRQPATVSATQVFTAEEANPHSSSGPSFHLAFLPYYLLLAFSILSQVLAVKSMTADLYWGLDYPAMETDLGYAVEAQDDYARIRLTRHPAPLILLSLAIAYGVYRFAGRWRPGVAAAAFRRTYAQCVPTSVGAATMVMMALIMTDTGMTVLLGKAIANGTGPLFPIFSPFIGVLGTFMTGSNTNSNVMFGALQLETARALGIGSVTVASIQSIGGSLGSSVAPAKVLVGTAIVGLSGRENEVLRRTIPYCLAIVLLVGIQAWIMVYVFSAR